MKFLLLILIMLEPFFDYSSGNFYPFQWCDFKVIYTCILGWGGGARFKRELYVSVYIYMCLYIYIYTQTHIADSLCTAGTNTTL